MNSLKDSISVIEEQMRQPKPTRNVKGSSIPSELRNQNKLFYCPTFKNNTNAISSAKLKSYNNINKSEKIFTALYNYSKLMISYQQEGKTQEKLYIQTACRDV
jgi:hypothetical protein